MEQTHLTSEELFDILLGVIEPVDSPNLFAHMQECAECEKHLEELKATYSLFEKESQEAPRAHVLENISKKARQAITKKNPSFFNIKSFAWVFCLVLAVGVARLSMYRKEQLPEPTSSLPSSAPGMQHTPAPPPLLETPQAPEPKRDFVQTPPREQPKKLPTAPPRWRYLLDEAIASKDKKQALKEYEKILKEIPCDKECQEEVLSQWVQDLKKLGQKSRAIEKVEQLKALDPQNPRVRQLEEEISKD